MTDQHFAALVQGLVVDEAAFRRDMAQLVPADRCYVVLFTARSGSTWLTSVLSATQKLGYPEEHLNHAWVRNTAQAQDSCDPGLFNADNLIA